MKFFFEVVSNIFGLSILAIRVFLIAVGLVFLSPIELPVFAPQEAVIFMALCLTIFTLFYKLVFSVWYGRELGIMGERWKQMKNIKFALYMILTSILLNGCVSMNASSSYVDKMTPEEASVISQSITKFVAKELPVASTTLALMPPTGKGSAILTPILTYDLRHRGFAVAQNGEPQKNIHSLQYIVTTFNNGILLRLQFDNIEASRWYSKDALGVISSDNEPFAVRK